VTLPCRLLLVLASLGAAACSGGGKGGGDGDQGSPPANPVPPPPAPSGSTTTAPTVPQGGAPPVGVTWHVGLTENVPLARMQALFASFVAVNNAIYDLSEGQVRIDRLRFYDNVAPGVSAGQFVFGGGGVNTANLDILVWPAASWDIPAGGAVSEQPGQGRTSRLMIIPENVSTFVLMHEGSHLLFRLTWTPGSLLVDEYADGVQDPACVMESQNLPSRWCSDGNHFAQSSQPHACWRQILLDYPLFAHAGSERAPAPPPAPVAEYNDTP